jgi:tight adherence protein B
MTGAVCCLAAAVLCWPAGSSRMRSTRLRPARSRPAVELAALVDSAGAPATGGLTAAVLVAVVSTPLVAALAGICVGSAVRAVRSTRRAAAGRRRARAIAEGLGVLAAELRAGRSVGDAAGAAVAGCPDDVAGAALGRVLRLGAGPPAPAAGVPGDLDEVLGRVAAAVRLSARTGCSLAGVAAAVEDDLRARARAETELRAAVAGPRASAAVLAGLPVIGLLMGSGVGADPWRVLTTTGTGSALLVAGVGLELTGVAWSARLVRRAVAR